MLLMIPVLLGVMFIVFTINYFGPGDPVAALLGGNYTQEQYDAKEKELGLDQPYAVQFVNYIKGIVTELDLGTSYQTRRAVRDEILERFPFAGHAGGGSYRGGWNPIRHYISHQAVFNLGLYRDHRVVDLCLDPEFLDGHDVPIRLVL